MKLNTKPLYTFGAMVLLFVALMVAISAIFDRALERQVTYEYFDEALMSPRETENVIKWNAPIAELRKSFTAVDAQKIGTALSEAWAVYSAAQETGQTDILPDYFTGMALERAKIGAADNARNNTYMVMLTQDGTPEFYHLDGSVFQAKFEGLSVRFAIESDKQLALFRPTYDTNVSVLMNESLGWGLYAHERIDAQDVKQERVDASIIPRLAGINYYPALTPWRAFWAEFDKDIIETDFKLISDLGANAIRIFTPSNVFMGEDRDTHLKNLQILLDLAQAHDLYVVPTLFDLKSGYDLSIWPDDASFVRKIAPIFERHKAVAFVDLKNEPDLDYINYGRGHVQAWIRSMGLVHRHVAPNVPLTVGWSSAEHAMDVSDMFDIITYHEYAGMGGTEQRLADIQAKADGKPVMITEIGHTSWGALMQFPGSPEKQAENLQNRMSALNASSGIFVWTLHDFPKPDPVAVGRSPWVLNTQSQFGLIDSTNTEKPAANVVRLQFKQFLNGSEL